MKYLSTPVSCVYSAMGSKVRVLGGGHVFALKKLRFREVKKIPIPQLT